MLHWVTSAGQRLDANDLSSDLRRRQHLYCRGTRGRPEAEETGKRRQVVDPGGPLVRLGLVQCRLGGQQPSLRRPLYEAGVEGETKKVFTSTREGGMCKDKRLESNPDLPVLRVNKYGRRDAPPPPWNLWSLRVRWLQGPRPYLRVRWLQVAHPLLPWRCPRQGRM